MTPEAWGQFCVRHPFLLYPVIIFQNELQSLLIGVKFWEDQTYYRNNLCDQQYMPFELFIKDMMKGKLDPHFEKHSLNQRNPSIIKVHSFESSQTTARSVPDETKTPQLTSLTMNQPQSRSLFRLILEIITLYLF